MVKKCIICGAEFEAKSNQKCCSSECSKERYRWLNRRYKLKNKEKRRDYYQEIKKSFVKLDKGKCDKRYPCRKYTYIYQIPIKLCLEHCGTEKCRFDDG